MALKTQFGRHTGRYSQNGTVIEQEFNYRAHIQSINVVDNPGGNNPFRTWHQSFSGGLLYGKGGFNEWDGALTGVYNEVFEVPPNPPDYNKHNRALALTNPSRASVLLPVFFWEIKDIPDMLRQAFRVAAAIQKRAPWRNHVDWSKPSSVAAANMAYQFGWAPLIGDIAKIANLGDATNKRIDELKRLASPKGLRRRITLEDYTEVWSGKEYVWSTGSALIQTDTLTTATTKEWAVVDWGLMPNQSYLKNPLQPMPEEVRLVLLGLTSQHLLENAWEALPWSWMFDWFMPMQTAIQAANRSLGRPLGGSIMTTSRVRTQYAGVYKSNYRFTSGHRETLRHDRMPLAIGSLPQASIPILNGRQLSVLGSLAILRARPSTGFRFGN